MVVQCSDTKFDDEAISELKKPGRYTHEYTLIFSTSAKLIFEEKGTGLIICRSEFFKLNVTCYFNIDNEVFTFSFSDKNKHTLDQYYNLVFENYTDKIRIDSLVDSEYKIEGKSTSAFFIETVRTKRLLKHDFFVLNNLVRINQDTRFFVSNMFLIKPYITDFLIDPFISDGKKYFRYFPSIYDKQYLLNSGILLELFYNYWDQVGDIIAEVFVPSIPKERIFFGKVIEKVPDAYKKSDNYNWLYDFKQNDYTSLNDKRKRVVHYNSLESDFFEGYQNSFSNETKLTELQSDKENLAQYFLDQHNKALKGFEVMTKLISEK